MDELRHHARSCQVAFTVPYTIEFTELPKTASGTIRKVELRERIRGTGPLGAAGNDQFDRPEQ